MERTTQEGCLPETYDSSIGPQPTSNMDVQPSPGTSDRGDTLQASEKITLHHTALDDTCTLGHALGMQRGEHMLTLSLLLVATLVTAWTHCNSIFGQIIKIWISLKNFTTRNFVTFRGPVDSPQ